MIKILIPLGWKITNHNVQRTLSSVLPFGMKYLPHNLVGCSKLHLSAIHWKSEGSDSKSEETVKSVKTSVKKRRENAQSLINDVSKQLTSDASKYKNRKQTAEEIKERLQKINDQVDSRKRNENRMQKQQQNNTGPKYLTTEQLMERLKKKGSDRTKVKSSTVDPQQVSKYRSLLNNREKRRLNIFKFAGDCKESEKNESVKMDAMYWWKHWENEQKMEMKATTPKNHYQEMIEWAEEGKFPNLPIENEIGMEEEENVSFHKHIFLHELIDEGFPKRGPVRKFMEAVALGLSMNPYLTVQEKEDHINWFRDYFKEKMDLLKTLGSIEDPKLIDNAVRSGNETAS